MNKLEVLKKLPQTKADVAKQFALIKESVINGAVDPLDFSAQITILESLFLQLKSDEQIKSAILKEAEKYGLKSFEKGNATFTIKEVGVKYDYSTCNDSTWDMLNDKAAELNDLKKERENWLKSMRPNIEVYGTDGVQINPPAKSSTTTVVTTFKI
jgi:hypothetical protein